MPARTSFDYAVLRVTPRVEREEFVNAGIILYSSECDFLGVKVHVDVARWRALWPEIDVDLVRRHLQAFTRICSGDSTAGPIAGLSRRQRFHWMIAPRSTMIQVSPSHSGLSDAPEQVLEELFRCLVLD